MEAEQLYSRDFKVISGKLWSIVYTVQSSKMENPRKNKDQDLKVQDGKQNDIYYYVVTPDSSKMETLEQQPAE